MLHFKRLLRRTTRLATVPREVRQAEERWLATNDDARAEARASGCKCGAPATHVRRLPVMGGVPFEVWTCAAHVNVNGWRMNENGDSVPLGGEFTFNRIEPRWAGWVEEARP